MSSIKKILTPKFRRRLRYVLSFLPDKLFLQLHYFSTTGRFINFKNPQGYCEKLQWIKIYDRHSEHNLLVDKLAVREHIKQVLGEEYLFRLLGCWKSFDEIDFDKLPKSFVLKCNHDSGSTKIIKDKNTLTDEDFKQLREHFNERLSRDYFYSEREYTYIGINPCILAEEYMVDKNNPEKSIEDYKFFCFNGEPKLMFIATDRNIDVKFDFFDMDFNHLDITNIHEQSGKTIKKPEKFEELKEIAAKLSQGLRQVRIDLYEIDGKIYFGEYTFFHGGGFELFYPLKWEKTMGDWIELS